MINFLSVLIIPALVLFIIIYGVRKKINVYDAFVEGTTESFDMILTIFPCVLAMVIGINIFLESGLLTGVLNVIKPILSYLKVPVEIIPMAMMRPISGNATLAILNNLFRDYGADGLIGRIGSVIQGSTETTFYVLTLYFGSVGIKKIRHSLWVGLLVDLIGLISGIIIVLLIFGV